MLTWLELTVVSPNLALERCLEVLSLRLSINAKVLPQKLRNNVILPQVLMSELLVKGSLVHPRWAIYSPREETILSTRLPSLLGLRLLTTRKQ
jgi:uncharacterized membrane protein